jgi:TRAP-type mannitol/chloroaromatic compound transport system permease small subunit
MAAGDKHNSCVFRLPEGLLFMISFISAIDRCIKKVGDIASLLILVIMALITYEVISRYVFNAPTSWVWLINKQLFGVFVLASGGYSLVKNSHIRIEVFYEHFSPPVKYCMRWLTFFAAFCFLGSLIWKSTAMGLDAWGTREKAMGVFKLPLYPLKMFMPVGAVLFLLGCIARVLRKD